MKEFVERKKLATLRKGKWRTLEVCLIRYDDGIKFDIAWWNREKRLDGISLTENETLQLCETFKDLIKHEKGDEQ